MSKFTSILSHATIVTQTGDRWGSKLHFKDGDSIDINGGWSSAKRAEDSARKWLDNNNLTEIQITYPVDVQQCSIWELEAHGKVWRLIQFEGGCFELMSAGYTYEESGDAENGPQLDRYISDWTTLSFGMGHLTHLDFVNQVDQLNAENALDLA